MQTVLRRPARDDIHDFLSITAGCLALAVGNHFFKFPNHFVFGGVTGIAVLIANATALTAGTVNLLINALLMVLGFGLLGRGFGIRTIYATALLTGSLSLLERIYPMAAPFTGQIMLEFSISILLTAFGSAILFHSEASSGGTDIIAMILKRQTGREIGTMLIVADCLIVIAAFFIFDIQTALFSSLGMLIKSILIDTSVARLNQSRMVNIICDDPEPVCAYITKTLNKGATFHEAIGAYSLQKKYIVISAMKPRQEIQLRRFIRDQVPTAFVLVADSSLIFGKGFAHIN